MRPCLKNKIKKLIFQLFLYYRYASMFQSFPRNAWQPGCLDYHIVSVLSEPRLGKCYDLKVDYPPQAHVFEHLILNSGAIWEGCGAFGRWSSIEEMSHEGLALRFYSPSPLPVQSLFPECRCNVARRHAFPAAAVFPPSWETISFQNCVPK